jgi:hypothetical protein
MTAVPAYLKPRWERIEDHMDKHFAEWIDGKAGREREELRIFWRWAKARWLQEVSREIGEERDQHRRELRTITGAITRTLTRAVVRLEDEERFVSVPCY